MKRYASGVSALALLVLVGGACASAQSTSPDETGVADVESVSLRQLVHDALERSPGLQVKKRAYEAARARVIAAWLPNDPRIGVDVEGQKDLFKFRTRSDREYSIEQTLPFPTTLIVRAQVAAREAQMAYQEYREEERSTVWHIEQPYYEFYLAQKTLAALEEVRELIQKVVKAAQARYESNQTSQQDLLKAQIESSKIAIDIADWQEKVHLAEAHFSHLMDRSLETHYTIEEPSATPFPELSRAELEQLALRIRPELKALEAGIRKAKASRMLAATQWLPELTGRFEARQFKGEGGIRENDTFLGVTVPVWSLLKGLGGEWKGAGKDVQGAEALHAEMKNEVFLAVHEAYAKAKVANYALRTYEELILPQAKQQVEVSLASYEAGRTEFLGLLDAQRTLRDTEIAYYRHKADYELGLSNLRLAIGGEWGAAASSGGTP